VTLLVAGKDEADVAAGLRALPWQAAVKHLVDLLRAAADPAIPFMPDISREVTSTAAAHPPAGKYAANSSQKWSRRSSPSPAPLTGPRRPVIRGTFPGPGLIGKSPARRTPVPRDACGCRRTRFCRSSDSPRPTGGSLRTGEHRSASEFSRRD
jgi:hypothetical protein